MQVVDSERFRHGCDQVFERWPIFRPASKQFSRINKPLQNNHRTDLLLWFNRRVWHSKRSIVPNMLRLLIVEKASKVVHKKLSRLCGNPRSELA